MCIFCFLFEHFSFAFRPLALKISKKTNYTELVVTMNHIWRELSLIYIANPRKAKIQDLPKFAARHLLDGFPLEMQDGETGILHSKWLTAVFEALTNLIGNTHIFVLSGKVRHKIAAKLLSYNHCNLSYVDLNKLSEFNQLENRHCSIPCLEQTLNAVMVCVPKESICNLSRIVDNTGYFRLEVISATFSSANFDIVINIKSKYSKSYEYIMILDTEGIRAPEFAGQVHSDARDNKMATMSIIPSDASIMMTVGDDDSAVKDILPIVLRTVISFLYQTHFRLMVSGD